MTRTSFAASSASLDAGVECPLDSRMCTNSLRIPVEIDDSDVGAVVIELAAVRDYCRDRSRPKRRSGSLPPVLTKPTTAAARRRRAAAAAAAARASCGGASSTSRACHARYGATLTRSTRAPHHPAAALGVESCLGPESSRSAARASRARTVDDERAASGS